MNDLVKLKDILITTVVETVGQLKFGFKNRQYFSL